MNTEKSLEKASQILAKTNELLDQFDFVGLTEEMVLSLKCLAEAWDLPYPKDEYCLNQNPDRKNYRSMVSDEVYNWFVDVNSVDYRLHDLVKSRLVEREPHPIFAAR